MRSSAKRNVRGIAWVVVLAAVSCRGGSCQAIDREALARECDPGRGCMNARFLAAVKERCGGRADCTLSIRDALPEVEKVWFVASGAARLDECATIPVAASIRSTYHPLCQYVLLQERGEVKAYLRGHCDDLRVTGDELAVDPDVIGNVTTMDPGVRFRVSTIRETDAQGREFVFRDLQPPRHALVPFTEDRCVGR